MRFLHQLGLLTSVCLWVGSLHAQNGAASAQEAIRALEYSRGDALLKADTTALAAMVADDFVEISRLGQLRTKKPTTLETSRVEIFG